MSTFATSRFPLTKLSMACVNRGPFGLHSIKRFIFRTHEVIVTDHLLVSGDEARMLDNRK
jgi:hypothetical protein